MNMIINNKKCRNSKILNLILQIKSVKMRMLGWPSKSLSMLGQLLKIMGARIFGVVLLLRKIIRRLRKC